MPRLRQPRPRPAPAVRLAVAVAVPAVLALAASVAAADGEETLRPWALLDDPRELPRLASPQHGRALLRSSYCPDGCRHDRHDPADPRLLRVDGDEGVIFEDFGAGVVTRLWMTTGEGVSEPLPGDVRLRLYLDGEAEPRLDVPLPALFDGSTPPFEPPLVAHRLEASGGNFSVVPMPYREGCRIALAGVADARLWYQVDYRELPSADGVVSFAPARAGAHLERARRLLASPGEDPWAGGPRPALELRGQATLLPEAETVLVDDAGPALVTGVRLRLPDEHWSRVFLRLELDGRETVFARLVDVFATGLATGDDTPARTLLVGYEPGVEELYAYFPLAYFERLRLSLESRLPWPEDLEWQVRRDPGPPHADSGLFTVQSHDRRRSEPGQPLPLLRLAGRGKWVGLYAQLGGLDDDGRLYLEGDERVWLDGERHPALHGTGVEDFFSAGFYFDRGLFHHGLYAMGWQGPTPQGDVTEALRLRLTDAVVFRRGVRAVLETGPEGDTPMRGHVVSYVYHRPPGHRRPPPAGEPSPSDGAPEPEAGVTDAVTP